MVLPYVYGRDNFLSLFHLQSYFIMDVLHENCVPNYLRTLHLKQDEQNVIPGVVVKFKMPLTFIILRITMSLICSRPAKLLESIQHPSSIFSMFLVRHTHTGFKILPLQGEKKTQTSLILLFLLSFAAPEVSVRTLCLFLRLRKHSHHFYNPIYCQ